MKEELKIFIVKSKKRDSVYSSYAYFDNMELVGGFVNRYKTPLDHEVHEVVLNPVYSSDPDQDPYDVLLIGKDDHPFAVTLCKHRNDTDDAERSTVDVLGYYHPSDMDDAQFHIKVMGKTEEDAIKKAIALRDEAIKYKIWESDSQSYQKFPKKGSSFG